jgi:hypothetical protein
MAGTRPNVEFKLVVWDDKNWSISFKELKLIEVEHWSCWELFGIKLI